MCCYRNQTISSQANTIQLNVMKQFIIDIIDNLAFLALNKEPPT